MMKWKANYLLIILSKNAKNRYIDVFETFLTYLFPLIPRNPQNLYIVIFMLLEFLPFIILSAQLCVVPFYFLLIFMSIKPYNWDPKSIQFSMYNTIMPNNSFVMVFSSNYYAYRTTPKLLRKLWKQFSL